MRETGARPARVLVVDDDPRVRSALPLLLEQELGAQIVALLADSADLECAIATARPDLVVLDWSLPGLDVGRAVAAVRAGRAAVVALGDRAEQRAAALAAGADAFTCRGDGPAVLLAACRRWLTGRHADEQSVA